MAQSSTTTTTPERLFLSRLSETYRCRTGDNILLECYVRHRRVKSLVWYAKGDKVEQRGVRTWFQYDPRTGQTILFLRSVLPCDEGSYCCEATSVDNVVETLEIKLKIDNPDKSWTKIPVLHMAGRVTPGGVKQLTTTTTTSK